MAEVKGINLHKRMAMGENITGMAKGGAVRKPAAKAKGSKMSMSGKGKKGC